MFSHKILRQLFCIRTGHGTYLEYKQTDRQTVNNTARHDIYCDSPHGHDNVCIHQQKLIKALVTRRLIA